MCGIGVGPRERVLNSFDFYQAYKETLICHRTRFCSVALRRLDGPKSKQFTSSREKAEFPAHRWSGEGAEYTPCKDETG